MSEYREWYRYCERCNDSVSLDSINEINKDAVYVDQMTRDNDFGYYVRESNGSLIFCFAGSNDIKDWISNVEFLPLKEGFTIHDGFYDSWAKFKDKITDVVLNIAIKLGKKNVKVSCVGHSRGAALATLCARHIAKNMKIPCKLVVFGCPKLGNKQYRDEFELLPIDAIRIINGWDIVTYLPPDELGFCDVGKHINITQPFWHHWGPIRIKDHVEYPKALDKAGI
jgi:predicted lipase